MLMVIFQFFLKKKILLPTADASLKCKFYECVLIEEMFVHLYIFPSAYLMRRMCMHFFAVDI